jgi:hypothetical protein
MYRWLCSRWLKIEPNPTIFHVGSSVVLYLTVLTVVPSESLASTVGTLSQSRTQSRQNQFCRTTHNLLSKKIRSAIIRELNITFCLTVEGARCSHNTPNPYQHAEKDDQSRDFGHSSRTEARTSEACSGGNSLKEPFEVDSWTFLTFSSSKWWPKHVSKYLLSKRNQCQKFLHRFAYREIYFL